MRIWEEVPSGRKPLLALPLTQRTEIPEVSVMKVLYGMKKKQLCQEEGQSQEEIK